MPQDDSSILLPWSICGFDNTTVHRLRLEKNAIAKLLSKHGNCIEFDEIHETPALKAAFSTREFSLLEKLFLFPLGQNNEITALIVISKSVFLENCETLSMLCTVVSELTSENLKNETISVKDHIKPVVDKTQVIRAIENSDSFGTPTPTFFCSFNIGNVAKKIIESSSTIDGFRTKQEIEKVVVKLIQPAGTNIGTFEETHLFSVSTSTFADTNLLHFQLKNSLSSLFDMKIDEHLFDFRSFLFDRSAHTAEDIFMALT